MKRRQRLVWHLIWVLALTVLIVGCDSVEVQGPEALSEADAAAVAAKNGAYVSPWQVSGPHYFDYVMYWPCLGDEIREVGAVTALSRVTVTPSGNFDFRLRQGEYEVELTDLTPPIDPYSLTRYHLSENWQNVPAGFKGHFTEIWQIQNERTGQKAEIHVVGQATVGADGVAVYEYQNEFQVCVGS